MEKIKEELAENLKMRIVEKLIRKNKHRSYYFKDLTKEEIFEVIDSQSE